MQKKLNALILTLLLCSLGCTGIVQKIVNTQPQVKLAKSSYNDLSKIVKGQPIIYTVGKNQYNNMDKDLQKYAPVIVQGFQTNDLIEKRIQLLYYADSIGYPFLGQDAKAVQIDASKPTVFSRVEYNDAFGEKIKQLVYVFWYPKRAVGTIEKGDIDGNILRISLDATGRPALFEYTQSCGCFHGVFAEEHLEYWAQNEFNQALQGKNYALEKKHGKNTDWVIRDMVCVRKNERPVLFISAGKHFCEAIQSTENISIDEYTSFTYDLQKYDKLTEIPKQGGGTGSMFNAEGLVLGAKRWKEEIVFSSIKNPGWPRHLDKMLIHWDEAKWTQLGLLNEYLRLPKNIVAAQPTNINISQRQEKPEQRNQRPMIFADRYQIPQIKPDLAPEIRKEYNNDKPYAVIFTHKLCQSCREFKNNVLPMSIVHSALSDWNFKMMDLFDQSQRELIEPHNISVTPTLIVFDKNGKEIRRDENIVTAVQFIQCLERVSL